MNIMSHNRIVFFIVCSLFSFTISAQTVIVSPIEISGISTTEFTLSWTNDGIAHSYIKYGKTPELELGLLYIGEVDNPSITIDNAQPSELYYVKALAYSENDSDESDTLVFITASLSSGKMNVYFTSEVNTSYANSSSNHAIHLPSLVDDTLVEYIKRAQETIDVAIYNMASTSALASISDALNDAAERGVRIRVIHNESTSNTGIGNLSELIPTLESPVPQFPDGHGLMHNKFIVFDAHATNPNLPIIWTGSTNLTTNQINLDPNNVIIIQDQSLAKAFTLEFNEMWGSDGELPNHSESKFGPFKKDNTPHVFLVNGKRVELYFSPSDGVNNRIVKAINDASGDLFVNTMLITRNDLADALISKFNQGVTVQVLVNEVSTSSTYGQLETALGTGIMNYEQVTGMLHHKLMFTQSPSNSSPYVLTGSHNWSTAADVRNDENTLIVYDADIVNQYYQEFMARYNSVVSIDEINRLQNVQIYPNPASESFVIDCMSATCPSRIKFVSISGAVVFEQELTDVLSQYQFDLNGIETGVYFVQMFGEFTATTMKLVVK
jgi:phosphatidylserine/phosphatidylglycerophosphate/cardiolipin synthase-like enzyme